MMQAPDIRRRSIFSWSEAEARKLIAIENPRASSSVLHDLQRAKLSAKERE